MLSLALMLIIWWQKRANTLVLRAIIIIAIIIIKIMILLRQLMIVPGRIWAASVLRGRSMYYLLKIKMKNLLPSLLKNMYIHKEISTKENNRINHSIYLITLILIPIIPLFIIQSYCRYRSNKTFLKLICTKINNSMCIIEDPLRR